MQIAIIFKACLSQDIIYADNNSSIKNHVCLVSRNSLLFPNVVGFQHVEEILGYLQVCVKAEPCKTFLSVQQVFIHYEEDVWVSCVDHGILGSKCNTIGDRD